MSVDQATAPNRSSWTWLPGALVVGAIVGVCDPVARATGVPPPVIAVFLGLAIACLPNKELFAAGYGLWAKPGLKAGVAMLGAQVAWADLATLGVPVAAASGVVVASTLGAGVLLGLSLGLPLVDALIAAAAVSICGASAAMAVSSALPETPRSRRTTTLVVVAANLLSTAAMIGYPLIAALLTLSDRQTGVLLGLSIHDVAQVAAAGAAVSPEAATAAALAKLSRVLWLGPVATIAAIWTINATSEIARRRWTRLTPPTFVWGFAALAVARSLELLPAGVVTTLAAGSHLLLLGGVVAISAQLAPRELLRLESRLIVTLILTSGFIALAGLIVALALA